MDKNKSLFYTLMVIFCVIIAGIGGFLLGTNFGKEQASDRNISEVQNGEK